VLLLYSVVEIPFLVSVFALLNSNLCRTAAVATFCRPILLIRRWLMRDFVFMLYGFAQFSRSFYVIT